MSKFSSHAHGVCTFMASDLFRFALTLLLLYFLPEKGAALLLIVLGYLMKEYCPHGK